MTVLLVVDMSASGRFGSRQREKRDLAAEIAAVLAFSAIRNNDRVGLIIFTDEVEKFVPPKKGKRHVLRVVSEILSFSEKSRRTALDVGLEFLGHVMRRQRGRVPDLGFSRARRQLRAGAAHHGAPPRSDPGDGERSAGGGAARRRLHRARSIRRRAARCVFDTGGPEAAAFARAARAAVEARKALFKRLAMDAIDVSTDRAYLPALTDVLRGARAEAAALSVRRGCGCAVVRRCWRRCSRAPRWAADARRGRGDAGRGAAAAPSIRTRPPSRRAPTATEAHVGDPIRVSVVAVAKTRRARQPAGDASIWGRSRCSAATRRPSRTWATAASGASSCFRVAAYEPGEARAAGDRGHLPGPARRGEDGRAPRRSRSRSPA